MHAIALLLPPPGSLRNQFSYVNFNRKLKTVLHNYNRTFVGTHSLSLSRPLSRMSMCVCVPVNVLFCCESKNEESERRERERERTARYCSLPSGVAFGF